jgi:hypothetical protein
MVDVRRNDVEGQEYRANPFRPAIAWGSVLTANPSTMDRANSGRIMPVRAKICCVRLRSPTDPFSVCNDLDDSGIEKF